MSEKTILLTGGAGYLGRCIAFLLKRDGYRPILVDNLSTSHRPKDSEHPFYEVELQDFAATKAAWAKIGNAHAVIHFAARALVPESCANPDLYFRNNLLATLNVAEASAQCGIGKIVHSSSCAVYGVPETVPMAEGHPCRPVTPYGESKRGAEGILNQMARYRGLRVTNLRYFNPGGSMDNGRLGEGHDPETHLIPNVVRAIRAKRPISVYGDDYPTPDGTCIRDFIHVEDLASAHLLALKYLSGPTPEPVPAINLGGGRGTSVREVIREAERVLNAKAQVKIEPRRPGDPPQLIADTSLARKVLGWSPRFSLSDILESHAQWESRIER